MPRWLAVTLAAGLAPWTVCIWVSYLPFGIASLSPDWTAIRPPSSGYAFRGWLVDLAAVLLLAFAAHAHGSWILERTRLELRGAERTLTSAGLGFAGLVLAASAMGFVSLFRPGLLRLLMVLFFATGLWRSRFWRWRWTPIRPAVRDWAAEPAAFAALLLTLGFFAITLLAAAAPETSCDALSWHLPTARFFLQQGRFSFRELYRSNTPHYGTVFYALGLAIHKTDLSGESAARMFNFLALPGMLLAGAALAARIVTRNGEPRAPLLPQALAALWIGSSPVVMNRATTCYPDLGASLWGVLAVLAFLQFQVTRRQAWVAFCGLFAGLAAGSKFVGFYWIAIGGLLVTTSAMLQALGQMMNHALSHPLCQEARRDVWRVAATFAIVSGAVCAPWLIRNWIYTGDPVLPILQKVLPHPRMDLREAANLLEDAGNRQRIAASLRNFLALPWRLTMEGDRWQGTIGPVFLWLAPFWLLGTRNNRAGRWIGVVLVIFSALWLKGPQWARYYLPALPLLAGLGAAGLCHPRLPRWLRATALAAGLLLPLVNLPGLNRAWVGGSGAVFALSNIPWDVTMGSQSAETYRRIQIPDYDAAVFVNAQALPESSAILGIPLFAFFPSWLTRFKVLDAWESAQAVCLDSNGRDAGCYHLKGPAMLRNMDRLSVNVLSIRRDQDWSAHREDLRLEDPFLRRYFRLLGYVGGTFLYQRDRTAPEPGLVYINADLTSRWFQHQGAESAGNVQLLPQGPDAADQRYALRFSGQSSASFDVHLGDRPQLVFSVAQDPRYFPKDLFGTLSVLSGDRELFEYDFSLQDLRHNWKEFRVDLAEFSGKAVRLEIRLTPQDAHEEPALAIADPVIYARETTQPVPEEGQRWLFNTATVHHPVIVGFLPNVVHPGMSYQMEIPVLAGQLVDLLYSLNGGEPGEALRFRRLDARGRVTVVLPRDFGPLPMILEVRGVRRSGDPLWLTASAKIEVRK